MMCVVGDDVCVVIYVCVYLCVNRVRRSFLRGDILYMCIIYYINMCVCAGNMCTYVCALW